MISASYNYILDFLTEMDPKVVEAENQIVPKQLGWGESGSNMGFQFLKKECLAMRYSDHENADLSHLWVWIVEETLNFLAIMVVIFSYPNSCSGSRCCPEI